MWVRFGWRVSCKEGLTSLDDTVEVAPTLDRSAGSFHGWETSGADQLVMNELKMLNGTRCVPHKLRCTPLRTAVP